jgi:hypothetical protein
MEQLFVCNAQVEVVLSKVAQAITRQLWCGAANRRKYKMCDGERESAEASDEELDAGNDSWSSDREDDC